MEVRWECETITTDEDEIRRVFRFNKKKDKYPLVYKQMTADRKMETIPVAAVALIQLDEDKKTGSLLIVLQDGTARRICSGYLLEMQKKEFSFDMPTQEVTD